MARLLEGLEKVIKGGGKPEELSKTTEAEKLPEISESSSVDFGDWLYCLEHTMGDISASSAEWWRYVVRDAQEYYDKYQSADQYARLSLKPSPSMELTQDRWSRVDRRGAAVLIAAVPEDVKKELVASRVKTTLDVLSRLMILYRPGSAMEKGPLLRRIENPEQAGSIQDAVEGLRHWQRYYQRAKDLRVNTPDPSILMRALDHMLKKAIADNPEVGFRMNLMRYHLRVDVAPTEDNVLAVHRAFLAEFEQMGYKKRAKGGVEQATGPRLRAMDKEQPQLPTSPTTIPKGGSRPCRFYLSDEGCRRGKSCKYEHSMKDLSKAERRDRCFECGAKGQLSSTCPTKKEVQQKAMSTGDSPQSSTGGTSNKKGGNSRRNAEEAAPEPAYYSDNNYAYDYRGTTGAGSPRGAAVGGRPEADESLHGAKECPAGESTSRGRCIMHGLAGLEGVDEGGGPLRQHVPDGVAGLWGHASTEAQDRPGCNREHGEGQCDVGRREPGRDAAVQVWHDFWGPRALRPSFPWVPW